MSTPIQYEVPSDFECPSDISDSKCGALNGKVTETMSNVVCDVCDCVIGGLFEQSEQDGMVFAEGDLCLQLRIRAGVTERMSPT